MRIFIPVSGTVFWILMAVGALCLVSLGWDKVKQATRTSSDGHRSRHRTASADPIPSIDADTDPTQ